jgi:hypothetical protein
MEGKEKMRKKTNVWMKELEIIGRVTLVELLIAEGHAFADGMKLTRDPVVPYVKDIMKDRRKGSMTDAEANINREEYHRFLGQLSKSELIDLIVEHFIDKGKDGFLDDLAKGISFMLNGRYLNRHPEEI